jgi:Domain of unknown function (DUF222)/HNH endonuclease
MFTPTTNASIQDACDALLESDRLIARALSIIANVDIDPTGLPAEMVLALGARRTAADARMLVNAARALRSMPSTASAFERGEVSWSQVRQIVSSIRTVDASGRARIDELIATDAERLVQTDPDEIVSRVDDVVSALRADLMRAREDRQIERGFLAVQGRLDGSASFYGEADAESAATIVEALDLYADRPAASEEEQALSRGRQRLAALVGMCEQALNGGSATTTRPRPRLLATVDIRTLKEDSAAESAAILWSLAGRSARITPLATEVLACDATVVPVIFDGARPVGVGDASTPVSSKLRAALVARDGRCRFPGCAAPVAWCDAHHIRARIHNGPTAIDNLVLLCRRCHRRVHRFGWKISLDEDGVMEFTRRTRTYASSPRAPSRE